MTYQPVQRVLLITMGLNFLVALGKIIIGLMSGVLAITADGFHSLMDGTSNIIALIANRIATQPPDEDHPYGHQRFETLAALLISAFLILTAWEIASGAVGRLQAGVQPNITLLTLGVLAGTLLVNIGVSTYQIRQGKRLRSQILLADAANTRADVFVTLSVLFSTTVVALTGQTWVDIAAALVVVGLIVRAAWRIFHRTSSVLVDKAPYSAAELGDLLADVPSVLGIVRARSRGTPEAAHIDIDVQVAPAMTADHTAAIASAIRERLTDQLEGVVEVEVHFMPDDSGQRDYPLIARAAADTLGVTTHEVRLTESAERTVLELHVEVPPDQTLGEAHAVVSRLERNLQGQIPEVDEVVTHIEPAQSQASTTRNRQIEQQAAALLNTRYPEIDWHHLRAYNCHVLTLHAALEADVSVAAAHDLAEQAEAVLRTEMPFLNRVTIHTEPAAELTDEETGAL